ncbi:MAG: 30S ribosomal protein S3 [candidate division Zixibacteria bacterium]|nr:30S ribosomal protein S3 [candidate division Zixibacteria bacterium]
MGQKTHPVGIRLGITRTWNSRWFASDRNYADLVYEDMMIKRYISRRLDNAGIAQVLISRAPKKVTVDIHTSRPGIVIGRKGAEVDKLRGELQLLTRKDIMLNIVEVRKPELSAQLVADSIARQLEGRIAFRRAMKKSLAATMKMGAVGIKLQCGGRLGGHEIARTEKYHDGRVPLHTLRANIDYATSTANTTYGTIGVKVWICLGEILDRAKHLSGEDKSEQQQSAPPTRQRRGRDGGGDRGRNKRPRGRVRRAGRPRGGAEPKGRRPDAPSPRPTDRPSGDAPAPKKKPGPTGGGGPKQGAE